MFNNLTLNLTSIFSGFPIFVFWSLLHLASIFLILEMIIFVQVFTGCAISFFLVVECSLFPVDFIVTGLPIPISIHNSFIHFHLTFVVIFSIWVSLVIKLVVSFLKFPLLLIRSISCMGSHFFLIIIINRLL